MKEMLKSLMSFNSERDQSAITDMGEFIRNNESITPEDKSKLADLALSVRDRMASEHTEESGFRALKGSLKVLGGVVAIAAFPAALTVVIPAAIFGMSGFKDVLSSNSQKTKDAAMASQKKMCLEAERFSNMIMGALENSPNTPENQNLKETIKRQGGDVSYLVAGFGVQEADRTASLADKLLVMREKNAQKQSLKFS